MSIVSDVKPDAACAHAGLPISGRRVLWSAPLPESGRTVGQQITLQVLAEPGKDEQVADVEFGGASAEVSPAVPFDRDLTDIVSVRAFGTEERCSAGRGPGTIALTCRAGEAPAGFVLTASNWRFPAGVPSVVELRTTHRVTAAVLDAADAPVFIGTPHDLGTDITVPASAQPARFALSVTLPEGSQSATVTGIRLRPATRKAAAPPVAAWSWAPADWLERGEDLIGAARARAIGALYVSVPIRAGRVADDGRLQQFVRRAGGAGIAVWAVDGDPRAALPSERATFRSRAKAYAAYNAGAPADARLAGVQYDVEPYLDPGWRLDPVYWQEAYRDFVLEMADAAGMPLELALPFWIAMDEAVLGRMLDPVAHRIASVAAMVYRTDAMQLQQLAEPFLSWGVRHDMDVRIALEAGPLPDEIRKVYRRAPSGPLWHLLVGSRPVLLLLDEAAANPSGTAFSFSHAVPVPASRISFLGDVARMRQVIDEVEPSFRGWPSFGGIAVHGVLPGW